MAFLLHEAEEAKKFDTRLVERHIIRGVITSEEVERLVKNLPDDGENGVAVTWGSLIKQEVRSQGRPGFKSAELG